MDKVGSLVIVATLIAVAVAAAVYWNQRTLGSQVKEIDEKAQASFAELYHVMQQQQQQQQFAAYHEPPPQPPPSAHHFQQQHHAVPPPPLQQQAQPQQPPPEQQAPAHPPRFGAPPQAAAAMGGVVADPVQTGIPGMPPNVTIPQFPEPIRDNVRAGAGRGPDFQTSMTGQSRKARMAMAH